jgi:hypothetical protein
VLFAKKSPLIQRLGSSVTSYWTLSLKRILTGGDRQILPTQSIALQDLPTQLIARQKLPVIISMPSDLLGESCLLQILPPYNETASFAYRQFLLGRMFHAAVVAYGQLLPRVLAWLVSCVVLVSGGRLGCQCQNRRHFQLFFTLFASCLFTLALRARTH